MTVMRAFKILPHVADMRLRVEASSLEELFIAALEGMNHILKRNLCKKRIDRPAVHQVRVSSPDTTALLIDFLSEALTLSHIHAIVFCEAEFTKLDSHSLIATLFGTTVERFDKDIKAVSYHGAEIKQNQRGNLQTDLVFDI